MTGYSERRDAAPVRIHTDRGSHIEPPLDPSWDDLTKLRWHAGVVAADTGLRVEVRDGAALDAKTLRPRPGCYSVNVGGSSAAAYSFHEAWTYLSGVSTGVRQVRRRTNSGGT